MVGGCYVNHQNDLQAAPGISCAIVPEIHVWEPCQSRQNRHSFDTNQHWL